MTIFQPCLIFLTIIFLHFVSAQRPGYVPVGSSLEATDDVKPWLSPSGDFAFGFQRVQGQDNFVLSIWYDKIPGKTIIWYPQSNATVSQGSKVELINSGGLVLSDPQGRQVWTSGSISKIVNGFMNDTGNFVLVGSNSGKIWESFNFPTDTILPNQVIASGGVIKSKITETNFVGGRFQLRLLEDGNLVLNTIDKFSGSADEAYYTSGTNDEYDSSNSGSQLILTEKGYMYILKRNGERFNITSGITLPSGDYYHRATLNSDGIFTQYYYPMSPSGNTSWEVLGFVPENICRTSGACGLNNVCSLDGNRRNCECPKGFSLPDSGNPSGDCNPDFTPSCKGYRGDLFDFTKLNDIDWPGGDYQRINPANEEICKASCLEDCSCAVAIYRSNLCWKKKLPLSNGRKDTLLNVTVFLKFLKDESPPQSLLRKESKGLSAAVKLITGFSSGLVGIILMCLLFVILTRKKKLRQTRGALQVESKFQQMHGVGQHGPTRNHRIELFIQNYKSLAPNRFQYSEIKKMTKSFQEKLGQGGYGSVYKGELPGGHLVAVKLLNEVSGDGEDFINEVASIGRTSHVNIVTLLGFCFEGNKRALIYEFMPNGSLDNFLRDDDSHLDWNTLFHVSKGIARGLEYLHRDCNTRIVHFDIKPHNVLLDEEFVPKISDFGLAKLCKKKESIVSVMGARGTAGYMAPEVFFKSLGGASHKSDVYSYGMMVLEMTGARKNNHPNTTSSSEADFPEWIYKKVEDRYHLGVDGVTTEQEEELAKKMVTVSLWCIQSDPSDRPPISKVVEMLEGSLERLQVPPKRIWSSPTRADLGTALLATLNSTSERLLTMPAVGEALSS